MPDQRTIDLTLEAVAATYEVAAGVQYRAWTFDGVVPAPVLHHIGNGMYGAVIIEPEGGYPELADRKYWLVQSEFYLKPAGEDAWTGDLQKMKEVGRISWPGTAPRSSIAIIHSPPG